MIVTIADKKGGTGKTTTAHALAAGLSEKGRKVLCVDMDSQRNLTTAVCGTQHITHTIHDMFTGTPAENIICHVGNMDIIPGSAALSTADVALAEKTNTIVKELRGLCGVYDYIIIDTPPNMGMLTTAAFLASDRAVIPAGVDLYSVQGVRDILEQITLIQTKANKKLKCSGVLLTRYDGRTRFTREVHAQIENMCQSLRIKLFKTVIRENISLKEAAAGGLAIFDYSPKSNGAKDYMQFVDEFLQSEG